MVRYGLGDLDIDLFVRAWLRHLATGTVARSDLLAAAAEDSPSGGYFLISNVGPKPGFAFAATEQLVLYSVLAVYQDMDLRWVEQPWQGTDHHLRHAFAYANQLGRSGVARVLLERIAERSTRPPAPASPLLPAPVGDDLAERAAHDRAVAGTIDRDIQAARLLDPTLSLDRLLLEDDS